MQDLSQPQEWTRVWHHSQLDVELLQASYIRHAYPRHSHDYYVICVIERGNQSFSYRGAKHYTPPGGLIIINPGAVHTGEPADAHGFQMRCIYPSVPNLQRVVTELTGRSKDIPYFRDVRIDDPAASRAVCALHAALARNESRLETESLFTETFAGLVKRYGEVRAAEQRLGSEGPAIRRACEYIQENYSDNLSLAQLAAHVSLSPYYLIRAFRKQVGMPPHAYQETVRIRHAQNLIHAGVPLAAIAAEVGYSSQSHLTRRFKQVIGVTPGQFAAARGLED